MNNTALRSGERINLTPSARAAVKLRTSTNAQFVLIVDRHGEATFAQRPGGDEMSHVKALRAVAMALEHDCACTRVN